MKGIILDASLALEWFSPQASAEVLVKRQLMEDHVALVPHLWRYEVMNVIATWRKRGDISEADSIWLLKEIFELPFAIVEEGSAEAIVGLATLHNLSAYDCAYLSAAMLTGEPLATLDQKLLAVAQDVGVECV